MKFHIVRNNETLEDIMFLYNLTKDEIVEENRHIRKWDKLVAGTKLKIPPISEAVEQDVNEMEPFVEDYYPKLNLDESKEINNLNLKDDLPDEIKAEDIEYQTPPVEDKPEPVIKEPTVKKNETSQKEKPVVEEILKPFEQEQKPKEYEYVVQPQANIQPALYPNYLGYNNYPRYIPYSIIYYPVYLKK